MISPTFAFNDLFKDAPLKELHLSPRILLNTAGARSSLFMEWIFRQNPGLRVVELDDIRGRRPLEQEQGQEQGQEQEEHEGGSLAVLLSSCREVTNLTSPSNRSIKSLSDSCARVDCQSSYSMIAHLLVFVG